jgi:anti-sigma factor RsiW
VYRHDQHVISITVLPRSAGESTGEESRDGYAVERWTAGDLAYWAVSDVARSDLRAFADLYRTQAAAQTH